jgi:hypothetical protein
MSNRIAAVSVFLVLAAFGVSVATAAPPAAPINPGKWQIIMHTTEPIDAPPMVSEACISPEAITKIGPPTLKATRDCHLAAAPSFDKGVLSYTITCPKLSRTTTTTMTFSGDSYTGTIVIQHGDGSTAKQTITAHRIGDCDSEDQ